MPQAHWRTPTVDLAAHEEIAVFLIIDQCVGFGRVEHRVPDIIALDVKVLVEETADLATSIGQIGDPHSANEDVLVEVHGVVAEELDSEPGIAGAHLGDHGAVGVAHVRLPLVPHPAELPIDPDTEAKRMARSVILHADVGEVDVPNSVLMIEHHQQATVRESEITRHRSNQRSSSSGLLPDLAGFQAGPPQAPIYSGGSHRPEADVGVKQCLDFHSRQVPPLLGQGSQRLLGSPKELMPKLLIRQKTAYHSFDNSVRHRSSNRLSCRVDLCAKRPRPQESARRPRCANKQVEGRPTRGQPRASAE